MYEFIFVSFLTTSGVFVQFCFSQKRCILYIKFFRWKKHTDDVKSLFKYDFQKKEKDVILY